MNWRSIDERVVHEGHVITTAVATFEAPDGRRIERDIVHHPGAVAVVAIDGDDVVLVRQFRCGPGFEMLEIPAGLRDVEGEEPELTAERELVEEIGLRPLDLVPLCRYHAAAGFCDELVHVFLATRFEPAEAQAHGVEEEHMQIVRIPVVDIAGMVARGEITDAKTILGVTLARERLAGERLAGERRAP